MTFFYTETKEKYKDGHWIRENILPYLYSYGSDGKYRKTKMTVEKIKENKVLYKKKTNMLCIANLHYKIKDKRSSDEKG